MNFFIKPHSVTKCHIVISRDFKSTFILIHFLVYTTVFSAFSHLQHYYTKFSFINRRVYEITADGFSLNDKCTLKPHQNNIPDLLEKWEKESPQGRTDFKKAKLNRL